MYGRYRRRPHAPYTRSYPRSSCACLNRLHDQLPRHDGANHPDLLTGHSSRRPPLPSSCQPPRANRRTPPRTVRQLCPVALHVHSKHLTVRLPTHQTTPRIHARSRTSTPLLPPLLLLLFPTVSPLFLLFLPTQRPRHPHGTTGPSTAVRAGTAPCPACTPPQPHCPTLQPATFHSSPPAAPAPPPCVAAGPPHLHRGALRLLLRPA